MHLFIYIPCHMLHRTLDDKTQTGWYPLGIGDVPDLGAILDPWFPI